ncbi:hypothetical protein [Desulfomonile tiedjei]|uniref:Glycosyltransferase RgtA/B/C/D-like domain-containing protein n=1 Tax=Desulfomonile tiedjei (strain ATCC 49306 / DSM 6799 / DCB-1) TaxID=706587 RepID=I4C256_DESTA|nr:hypothetical protein [Desulfomonile tiedjei]AFM23647.1 hypothetical protein Desti_0928 [Desulfomonile tiedjei DSM 6799]
MTTERSEITESYLWIVGLGLFLYCFGITAMTGDIGFDGDDWWVLAYPYWNSFTDALRLYAQKFLRPVEGLYWIGLFKLFGFNKMAFHLCSLLLLAGSALSMGLSLDRAFPGRRIFVSMAVLFAFFLPPVSCLTYVLFTDNSRLSVLLFWLSVLAFQRWARKSSSWSGIILPVIIYMISFLTYESTSFLIFTVPLLVWPVHQRCVNRPSDRIFFVRLCGAILSGFLMAVAVRFIFLNGGAVTHSHLLPPLELLWSYLALLWLYLIEPFMSVSADRWALIVSTLVSLGAAFLFLFSNLGRSYAVTAAKWFESGSQWYLILLGTGILFLGMLPYQLAGYGNYHPQLTETLRTKWGMLPDGDLSWFNFTWASRIYSSASFGVAVLIAAGLSVWQKKAGKFFGRSIAVALIGFMALFHAGLSIDWREAADIRNDLIQSLVTQVPAVKPGTHFVFLDLNCSHKRAEVFRKENGLRELVWMLYADRSLGAWRAYSRAYGRHDHLFQQSSATPEGFMSRGQRQSEPAPHESLLLLKRSGNQLILVDRINAGDGSVPTGIAWQGTDHLASNLERIEPWSSVASPNVALARTAWTSGLISTLRLKLLKSTRVSVRGFKYMIVRDAISRYPTKILAYPVRSRL